MKCHEAQDMIPLMLADLLNPSESDGLNSHIEICRSCKEVYDVENRLVKAAKMNTPDSPLAEHPDVDILISYVFSPADVDDEVKASLVQHLGSCTLCREEVENLRSIPHDSRELLTAFSAPTLTRIDADIAESGKLPTTWARLRAITLHPVTGYAVAAGLLIALVVKPETKPIETKETVEIFSPAAVIDVLLTSATRELSDSLILRTPTSKSFLKIKLFVGPEEGHNYSFRIVSVDPNGIREEIENYVDFDPQGFASFEILSDTGHFEITTVDILGTDTLTATRQFRLQQK